MRLGNLIPSSPSRNQMRTRPRRDDPVRMLQSDIDRAFEGFLRIFDTPELMTLGSGLGENIVPRLDVRDKGNEVEVDAELPGVNEKDIDISISDGALTITAETKAERDVEEDDFIMHERRLGRISRVVPLPAQEIDTDNARAEFKNGLLTVRIPKRQDAQKSAKRVEVKSS
jgi:HSP20 family protein